MTNLPELPPGWEWSPDCGVKSIRPFWSAFGPKIRGLRLEVYEGSNPDRDTPEGCANLAWQAWESLSGLTKDRFLRKREAVVELLKYFDDLSSDDYFDPILFDIVNKFIDLDD